MFVKQVDMNEAFRLAIAGQEVKVLVPTGPGNGWACMEPDTLQNMLGDVMFFRQEPAAVNPDFEAAVQAMENTQAAPPTLMEQLQELPETPRNRPASVWVPVANGSR